MDFEEDYLLSGIVFTSLVVLCLLMHRLARALGRNHTHVLFRCGKAEQKALALLKRHFFEYERYKAVRTKEMMEARVDIVFASLRNDATFMALTNGADGRLPMPMNQHPANGGGGQ